MTSRPDRQRRATTWIVIGVVAALAMVATLLTVNLLANLPTGTGPSATESLGASATSGATATPFASVAASSTPAEIRPASWTATGSMNEAHQTNTATLLLDGRVLVVGGSTGGSVSPYAPSASVELYDPGNGSWTAAANMSTPRSEHTATLLLNGTVLVTGGKDSFAGAPLASAEVYYPATGSWTSAGPLIRARAGHTATRLSDGRVLAAGGSGSSGSYEGMASAELFDPISGSWTVAESMHEGRYGDTATLLLDGTVLLAGGDRGSGPLASAELYDPGSGTWTAIGEMIEVHGGHTATLLLDGTVLVAGGQTRGSGLVSAELYDPGSGTWIATAGMIETRRGHTATQLRDGMVLVAGGCCDGSGGTLASAELYDPGSGT